MEGYLRTLRHVQQRGLMAAGLVLSIAALCRADNPPVESAKEQAGIQRVAGLIEQLGSEDFQTRERAQSELASAGLEAYDALHQAQSHYDPEIALRARYLVRSMSGSVRWFADTDSPKVVAILKEYGDLQEAEKRSRIDRLAELENWAGVKPLIRLARFETLDVLAKYAALQVMQMPPPEDAATRAELLKDITAIVGNSNRSAAAWLKLYGRTLADPLAAMADWERATQVEQAVWEKSPDRTSREIVRDLYRYQVELLKQHGQDEAAHAAIRRTFALLDGTPEQLQETVDWLMHREVWPVALEAMQKFDGSVQVSARLLYRLAAVYDALQQSDKAEETAAKALSQKPESISDHMVLGRELDNSPRMAKWAEAEFRHVVASVAPGSAADFRSRFTLAELLHDRLKELPAAEVLQPLCDLMAKDEMAKQTCLQNLERPAEEVIARMNYFYASHFHDLGDVAKEKEHLKIAVQAHDKDADVLIAMYRLKGADADWQAMTKAKIEAATAEFKSDAERQRMAMEAVGEGDNSRPELQWAYARDCNQYAWLVGNTFGDHQLAVKLSEESVRLCRQLPILRPNMAGFLDTLGRAHYGAGDVASAVKNQSLAVSLNPASGQIQRQLGFFQSEAKSRGIEVPETPPLVLPEVQPPRSAPRPAAAPNPARPANPPVRPTPSPSEPRSK